MKPLEEAKKELKSILDLPILYTAMAILIAHSTQNELTQLSAFVILLIITVIRKHDSRISIAFALILLALSAFQLAFMTETAANNTAILAYYLLCVGVIAQFIEYIKNPEDEAVEDEKEIMAEIPKDTGSGSISSALEDIALIIKNTIEKLTGLIKKSMSALKGKTSNDIYSANHDYTQRQERYSEIDKNIEDVRKRLIERNRKR